MDTATTSDAMVDALLPRVVQRLDETRRGLANPETEDAVEAKVRDLGWVLGVLAGATGADLLRSRREQGGLETFLTFIAQEREKQGFTLRYASPPPRLTDGATASWELPFAVGRVAWEAALGTADVWFELGSETLETRFSLERAVPTMNELEEALAEFGSGARLASDGLVWTLSLPSDGFGAPCR